MDSYRIKKWGFEPIEKRLMIVFGFLAPAPIISLLSITAYVWGLMIVALYIMFTKRFRYKKRIQMLIYTGYILVTMFSAAICLSRMPHKWSDGLITRCIQILAVFIIYIYADSTRKTDLPFWFIKGVFYSAIFQMIWGFIQLISSHMGLDINTLVFTDLLHMFDGSASQLTTSGRMKISGLCWNAGNFAPLMIFGFIFAKNKYLKLSFVLVSLLSGSRTLMLGIIICIFVYLLNWLFTDRKISKWLAYVMIGILSIGVVILFLNPEHIANRVSSSISSINVFKNYYTEGSTNTHIMYLLKIPDITVHNNIITNLFGYGPDCSGYAYVSHYGFYSQIGQWTVECDYVNILWNYGYLGFCLYYIWLLVGVSKGRKLNNTAGVFYFTYLLMGFMYNITFNWMHLTNIMIFVLVNKGVDVFSLDLKREKLSNLQMSKNLISLNHKVVLTTGE